LEITAPKASVREAKEGDFPRIWEIYQRLLEEGIYTPRVRGETALEKYESLGLSESSEKSFTTLLCEVDGRVVGYATIEEPIWDLSRHVGELGIAVLPEYRRIGVGSALLGSLFELASKKGFEKITLSVFHTNRNAISLYRRFGFKTVGRKKRQFKLKNHYIDELIMEKFIG
jgi:ribosomal protein S18 acetylase RimI-like enzyme